MANAGSWLTLLHELQKITHLWRLLADDLQQTANDNNPGNKKQNDPLLLSEIKHIFLNGGNYGKWTNLLHDTDKLIGDDDKLFDLFTFQIHLQLLITINKLAQFLFSGIRLDVILRTDLTVDLHNHGHRI